MPLTPASPSGGYDNGSAPPGPVAPASGNRFQASIDKERALNQSAAATYAAAAPLPTATAATPAAIGAGPGGVGTVPITPTPGQYNGANMPQGYKPGTELKASDGSNIPLSPISPQAAQQTAQAARTAFVNRNNAAADMGTGGYFTNQRTTQDANARQNAETGAGVAESTGRTNFLKEQADQTRQLTPTMVKQGEANAGLTTSQSRANDAGAPAMAAKIAEYEKRHGEQEKRIADLEKQLLSKQFKEDATAAANQRTTATEAGRTGRTNATTQASADRQRITERNRNRRANAMPGATPIDENP